MENALNERKVITFLTIGVMLVLLVISFLPMLIAGNVGLGISTVSATWAAYQEDLFGVVLGLAGYWAAVAAVAAAPVLSTAALIWFL
jgi:type III secretory pathway component EscS